MAIMPTDKSNCIIWGEVGLSCFRFAFRQLTVRIPQFFDLISQFQRKTIAKLKRPRKSLCQVQCATLQDVFSLPEKERQLLHAVLDSKK